MYSYTEENYKFSNVMEHAGIVDHISIDTTHVQFILNNLLERLFLKITTNVLLLFLINKRCY